MYKVVFEYANGRRGTCIEAGEILTFTTEQEAEAFATKLNEVIELDRDLTEEDKTFFPVRRAEKV